jgi:hypothetical protein
VNPKAPEENYPPLVGQDLTWVAGVGGAKGMQPITATNPNGDYAGVSPMSPSAFPPVQVATWWTTRVTALAPDGT